MELMGLDECVENALELFSETKLPVLKHDLKRPIVLGSGNAAVTGKILFEKVDAIFADESNYKKKLKASKVDGAILISASGGKHAPIIARYLRRKKIKTILITNNENALAKPLVSKTLVLPKNVEPYTYNTSTYMGMLLSYTKEDTAKIFSYIKHYVKPKIKDLKKYDSYFFIVPNKFENTRELFLTKFDELFGSKVTGRVFTPDQSEHAKTIVPNDKELFIAIGYDNKIWGKDRLNIKLPPHANHVAVMAITYWIIGQIQRQNPPYFKDNIEAYTKKISKLFGQKINPIVE